MFLYPTTSIFLLSLTGSMGPNKKRKASPQPSKLGASPHNTKKAKVDDSVVIDPQWSLRVCSAQECPCELYSASNGSDPFQIDSSCTCGHENFQHRLALEYPSKGVVQVLSKISTIVHKARSNCLLNHRYWVLNTLEDLHSEVNKLHKGVQGKKVSANLTTLATSLVNGEIGKSIEMIMACEHVLSHEARLRVLFVLDNIYYQTFNYKNISDIGRKLNIAEPAPYFESFFPLIEEAFKVNEAKLWNEASPIMRDFLHNLWHLDDYDNHDIDLLKIFNIKWKESIALIYGEKEYHQDKLMQIIHRLKNHKQPSKKKSKKKKSKKQLDEPICHEALQKWRDICRDWPSLIYSYAIPTPEALQVMKKYAPLVEIGAGTGYWIYLLKKMKVDIIGYDVTPLTENGEQNEFHANSKPFVNIAQGSSEKLLNHSRTLFLCFPPPDSDMALDCLRKHKGDHFIHVGEWFGFTGSLEFTKELLDKWTLIDQQNLPNWADTNYNMTVWKRKSDEEESALLECTNCSKLLPGCTLRQCKCCRNVRYCTKECMIQGKDHHEDVHRISLVFCENIETSLDFSNPLHYRPLKL